MSVKSLQHCHCLIVDHDVYMRRILRQMLRQLGLGEIDEAKDGAQAFAMTGQTSFQIVITELQMPIMGGVELTGQIRHAKTVENAMPVIGYTSNITPELVTSARDSGINELMTRPFSSGILERKLNLAVLNPRTFTRSPSYIGPCRRRKPLSTYIGSRRREADRQAATPNAAIILTAASQDQLTKRFAKSPS